MFKGMPFKKNSVILAWLFSYLTFLCLFVIISVFVYFKTSKVVESEINQSNILLLERIEKNMDNVIIEARKLGDQLISNNKIQSLANLRGELQDYQYNDVSQITKNLNTYRGSSKFIDEITIYLRGIDLAISSTNATDLKTYYRSNYTRDDEDYIRWVKKLQGNYTEKLIGTQIINPQKTENTVVYIRQLSMKDKSDLSPLIVISMNKENFIKEAKGLENYENGTILILDENNQVIASSGELSQELSLKYSDLNGSVGMLHTNHGTEKVVASYMSSKINKLKYVFVAPEKVYLKEINHTRNLTIGAVSLCIVLGNILIWFFLRRSYNPIKQLVLLLKDHAEYLPDNKENEYSLIQKAIKRTIDEKNLMGSQLDKQKFMLRDSFLKKLLRGYTKEEIPTEEKDIIYNIDFKKDYFSVILFFIEDNNNDLTSYSSQDEAGEINYVLCKVINEIFSQYHSEIVIEGKNSIASIINIDDDGSQTTKFVLAEVIEEVNKIVKEHFNIELAATISTVHKGISGIAKAYSEAVYTMKYKKVYGIDNTLFFEDIKDISDRTYYYPLNKEEQLINYIKSGDYIEAKHLLDEIFQNNFESNYLTIELAECFMLNLVSTMLRTVNEISNLSGENLPKEIDPVKMLLPCSTIEEMKVQINEFLKNICGYLELKNSDNSKWTKNVVIPFLNTHFSDKNLNITKIAEHFNMHPGYLSRLFKLQTGEGLLDYINKIRVQEAKILIKENNIEIDDAALKVGYSNVRTFYRTFKKYEGITPGQYKEI